MAQYAQDAAETDSPWERWECKQNDSDEEDVWCGIVRTPSWRIECEYRRKRRMMRIGDVDVPMPITKPPRLGQFYFIPSTDLPNGCAASSIYSGDAFDRYALENGLMHSTKEDACAHAAALIKITKDAMEAAK
jgi:hypothetical protein